MKIKKGAVILAFVMAVSLLSGCGRKVEGEASVQSVAMICGIGPVGQAERFAGVTVAQSETKIQKDSDKTIAELKVEAGDKVKKNQVLFSYEKEQTELDLEKAKLELEQLKNSLSVKKSEKSQLEADKKKAGAGNQLAYTLEIQEVDTLILEINHNISVKEKEIKKMEETLKNLEVKAPVSGHIQSINAEGAMDNYGNPLPFITIVASGSYRVTGYVNESNVSAVQEGQAMVIRSRIDDTMWSGTVTGIDWENPVQSGNNSYMMGNSDTTTTSNKYPFYVDLDDDEGLILGQHVYIEVDYGQMEEQDISDEEETDEDDSDTDDGEDTGDEDSDDVDTDEEDKEDDGKKDKKNKDTSEEKENKVDIPLPSFYINDIDGSPWVWAQDKKGLLEKRNVVLGEYDEEMDTYLIESGLTLEEYIAVPDDKLQVGMKCVIFDETAFETGGMEGTDMPGMEGGDISGMEGGDISGMEGGDMSDIEGTDMYGTEGEDISDMEGDMDTEPVAKDKTREGL